jgi:hypothetical protein
MACLTCVPQKVPAGAVVPARAEGPTFEARVWVPLDAGLTAREAEILLNDSLEQAYKAGMEAIRQRYLTR